MLAGMPRVGAVMLKANDRNKLGLVHSGLPRGLHAPRTLVCNSCAESFYRGWENAGDRQ